VAPGPLPDRMLSARQVVERLYGPGGPKEDVRFRRDYAEKREIAWRALLRKGHVESGRFGTTFAQLAVAMHPEMAALSAKPWKQPPAFAEHPERKRRLARHEWMVWHYAPFVRSILNDFRQIGLLTFSGDQDNNGFYMRIVVQLQEPPDGQPASSGKPDVDGRPREPLRGPERGRGGQVATGRCNGLQQACACRDEAAPAKAGDPAFSSNSDSPLREAGYAGSTTTNLESVSNNESFVSRPGAHAHQTALSDDDLSGRNAVGRSAEKPKTTGTEKGECGPIRDIGGLVDAAVGNRSVRQRMLAVAEREDLAFAHRLGVLVDCAEARQAAAARHKRDRPPPSTRDERFQAKVAAASRRVAAREAEIAPAAAKACAQQAERDERLLANLCELEVGERPPAWQLAQAFEAIQGRPAKFAAARHGLRLARVLDRYERYRDCRPDGWPAAAAAALVQLVKDGQHTIGGERIESLAGYLHQLDRLSRHMRRAYKRSHAGRYDEAARRRAARRAQERERQRGDARLAFRRPLPAAELETLQHAYTVAADDPVSVLNLLGRLATPEQLRRELRDRYLLEAGRSAGYGGWAQGACWRATEARGTQPPTELARGPVGKPRSQPIDTTDNGRRSETTLLATRRRQRPQRHHTATG